MNKLQCFLLSVLAGLQAPFVYWLSGHSLFVRDPGLGWMWYAMCTIAVAAYLFLLSFVTRDKK